MKYFLATLIFWVPVALFSQPLSESRLEDVLDSAKARFAIEDWYNSANLYEEAYNKERDFNVALLVGFSNYQLKYYKKAESWFNRVVRRDPENNFQDARYWLAKTYKAQGKYTEAEEEFRTYLDYSTDLLKKEDARQELKGIEMYSSFPDNPQLSVVGLGSTVNSYYDEYSPVMDAAGTLYFTSYQWKKREGLDLNDQENKYAKVYTTSKNDRGRWVKPKEVGGQINRPGLDQGNVSISPDGSHMFITRFAMDENQVLYSTIVVSVNSGSQWGPPIDLKGLDGDYIIKHPVLGELFGNEVLFFTSDMPGGYGGNDIYYAEKISVDNYSSPVNLGPNINTSGDDETPFYKDGLLYFSSTGHPGMGGYDIFQSTWDGSKWSSPENMGRGYNTSYNDRYFSLGADGESGYITSNRPSKGARAFPYKTCCDDISYFTLKEIEIQLLATVFEKDQPILGADVKLIEFIEEDYGPSTNQTSTETNEFSFSLGLERAYAVVASAPGYYSDTLEVNSVGLVDSYVFNRRFDLKPIPKEPDTRIITINEPIRLNNIYYDLDDDKILLDAEKDLNFIKGLMEQYPDMVIELGSHTDSQGRDKYNEDLSKRRSESAKRWLAKNGIAASRVKAVGYGERIILNQCVNNVKCTDDEHRFNRRTEFKILSGPTSIEIKKEIKGGLEDPSNSKSGSSLGLIDADFETNNKFDSKDPIYAKLTFEKSFHDFGIIKKGEKKTHEFKFTNTGKANLVIETASACECTEVEWPEEPIKPGEKGVIKATYDSTDKEGEQEVNIDIIANVKTLVVEARFRVFVK